MKEILPHTISILGCGWLGKPLALALKENGFQVRTASRSDVHKEQLNQHSIAHHHIDLNDREHKFDKEFIAETLIIALPPSKFTLESLNHFLIQSVQTQKLRKIILISSTGIYKNHHTPVFENTFEAIDIDSKIFQIENVFKNFSGIELLILRMGGLIGYDRNPINFLKSEKVLKNPCGRINFIHRDDAIRLILEILKSNVTSGIFNCCCDEHPTKKEFYNHLCRERFEGLPNFSNDTQNEFKIIDNSAIKSKINFQFSNLYTLTLR